MVSEHILSQIVNENEKEVFKSMRSDMNTAKALLNEEQFAQFMRAATINQTILADASFRRMNSTSQVVSSTKVTGRVLQTGYKTVNNEQVTQNQLTPATIGFGKAELNATKLKALTSLLDDDKEDNIEREAFEQTLLSMMGEAVGVDLEAVCVFIFCSICCCPYTALRWCRVIKVSCLRHEVVHNQLAFSIFSLSASGIRSALFASRSK